MNTEASSKNNQVKPNNHNQNMEKSTDNSDS